MNNAPFSLWNKHILILGASSGIGRETAIFCAKQGAVVTIVARRGDKLEEVLAELTGEGHRYVVCDMSNNASVDSLVSQIVPIDGLVFCVGTLQTCPTKFLTAELAKTIMEVNLFGFIQLMSLIQRRKKINSSSSIVVISSTNGSYISESGNGAYAASKAGLIAYSKTLALELFGRKIRVNTISPGMLKTDFLEKVSVETSQFEEDEKRYPLGYGTPEDVASAVIFFLSDEAKWITGTNLLMDGGLTLR